MTSFSHIIDLWPSAAEFGRDISVSDVNARAMKRRNSIPNRYWRSVIDAAGRRGIDGITIEFLAEIAAERPRHDKAEAAQ